MKILIVDDSSVMRKIIIGNLAETDLEFEAVEASDGVDALEKIKNWGDIDVVLCDWIMPRMDGMTFIKELRRNTDSARSPIIVVTTEGSIVKMEEALTQGANDYIVKPFTAEELYQRIINLV